MSLKSSRILGEDGSSLTFAYVSNVLKGLTGKYLQSYIIKHSWKARCPILKAIVAGFRGKVALKK